MNRRKFIENTSLFAFGISITPMSCVSSRASENELINTENCGVTTDDILGPFFRENAPVRSNIRLPKDIDKLLTLKGRVTINNCDIPANNFTIDFWQANHAGNYDNDSSDYNYRAKVITDSNGNYELKTIIPGRYLNGNQFRPSHIHLRIRNEKTHELISQIYFKNDPYINIDPWASDSKAINRILETKNMNSNEKEVIFNINLKTL